MMSRLDCPPHPFRQYSGLIDLRDDPSLPVSSYALRSVR
jgi:hypothetical protein